jgi:predicted short-subunit dehydrogenase-like oxidoreductase (DUF2520 family)
VDPIAIGARGLARSEPLPSAAPDAVWILVRDNAIAEVTGRLVHIAGLPASIPILHAAGARVAADVLQAASAAGHPVGTAHPICSLRTERPWPSHLGSAGFGIEGDDAARAMALSWIDGQPWIDLQGLSAADRQRYHAACSLAANHLAVLLRASADILQRYGATKQAGERMIGSLLRSALSNLLCLGIPEGITGPVARGDGQAVADHIAALEPEDAELYRVLSARLAAIVDQGRRGP